MDSFTRQFIAVRRKLDKILDALIKNLESIHEQLKRDHQQRERQYEENRPISLPTLRVNAECKTEEDERRQDRASGKRYFWVQVLLCIGTWLAFCAAAYYAHYAKKQWSETAKAVIVATTANGIAQNTLDEVHRNFLLDERAWVGIEYSLNATPKGGFVIFNATGLVKNSGKTPALKMSFPKVVSITRDADAVIDVDEEWRKGVESFRKFARKKLPLDAEAQVVLENMKQKWSGEGQALAPSNSFPFKIASNDTRQYPDPKAKKPQFIYWLGRFTYYDIFQGDPQRVTKFCLRYTGQDFEACPFGNDMN